MKLLFTILILAILFFSCLDQSKKKTTDSSKTESSSSQDISASKANAKTDSVLIPTFKINLDLSKQAEKKLNELNESIIVSASFSGIPKDTTSTEFYKMGQVTISSARIELFDSRVAEFKNFKIAKTAYEDLVDKNYEVLINVFTGRRVDKNNLLSCDILSENIETVKGKEYTLKGKLIEEL